MSAIASQISSSCLLNCFFERRSKKAPKLRVTGLCEGNSPVTGEFHAQKASNAENVSFELIMNLLAIKSEAQFDSALVFDILVFQCVHGDVIFKYFNWVLPVENYSSMHDLIPKECLLIF